MRYYLSILASIFIVSSMSAQKTVAMSAVQANDYGIAYSLPKTVVDISVKYKKTTKKAGAFYTYAERYLNISDPISANEIVYSIENISAVTRGVIDKSKSYLVEFRNKNTASFVTLTKEGLICAINSDYVFPTLETEKEKAVKQETIADANQFLSEEILRAGSTAKQAELIAKQIYLLRESRNNILTGEADNMPPDGNAYKLVMGQLDEQEKALTALFIGHEEFEYGEKTITLEPTKENIKEEVVARFSSKLGLIDKHNLAGAPIYLTLTNRNPIAEKILTDKEQKDLDKKFSEGIVYNIPNKADLTVVYKNKTYTDLMCDVVQYGSQEVLISKMFDNNKTLVQVIFYPEVGTVKQITQ